MADRENGKVSKPADQSYTVKDVCLRYLKDTRNLNTKAYCSGATYELRYRFLSDLCEGGPPKGEKVDKGYGNVPVNQLIGKDIQDWLGAHNWNGTRRTAFEAIRRAVLWCKDLGMVDNPRLVFKAGVAGKRKAYFSEEQEKAVYEVASKGLAEAIRVMIATGARPGECARLEARHVDERPQGQLWRFPPNEHETGSKTGEDRVVPVPPEIAALVTLSEFLCQAGRVRHLRVSSGMRSSNKMATWFSACFHCRIGIVYRREASRIAI